MDKESSSQSLNKIEQPSETGTPVGQVHKPTAAMSEQKFAAWTKLIEGKFAEAKNAPDKKNAERIYREIRVSASKRQEQIDDPDQQHFFLAAMLRADQGMKGVTSAVRQKRAENIVRGIEADLEAGKAKPADVAGVRGLVQRQEAFLPEEPKSLWGKFKDFFTRD